MQTYANFTVGGSLSVNCHGRYVGLGPLILSVNAITIALVSGELIHATPQENSDIFYASIGGYGALGIIVEAELSLEDNTKIERIEKKMDVKQYPDFFTQYIRNNRQAIFHNADLIPPKYKKARAVTWYSTNKPVNTKPRKNRKYYLLEKYMLWIITETKMGHLRREYIYEPLLYLRSKITYRNDEANYDVAELEPVSRAESTYVLQEYFVPVDKILEFISPLKEILNRFSVNVVNISIRHAHPDPGSYLAWASEEVFAFVLYYKQRVDAADKERVAVWTRELIDHVINCGGRYYLPYQPHASYQQFHQAYPHAKKLFKLKDKLDPNYQFRHCLWEKYYHPNDDLPLFPNKDCSKSEFLSIYNQQSTRDGFYLFLQNIYHLYPEHKFHQIIIDACTMFSLDEDIYNYIAQSLPSIKPVLSELTYALPALFKQKNEMAIQTSKFFEQDTKINGYLEIGSTGRYIKPLKKQLNIEGNIYLSNDNSPDNSPAELMERGSIKQVGEFFLLDDYNPITTKHIADESLDLVTCYIGLHHCPSDKLSSYIESIARVLRPNGKFILRDHDADDDQMKIFCSLVHTVFNAGLGVSWKDNQKELRLFNSVDHWIKAVKTHGFEHNDEKQLQDHDPSLNTLLCFTKQTVQ